MTLNDIKNLENLRKSGLIEWLREQGAASVDLGGFRVEFAPVEEKIDVDALMKRLERSAEETGEPKRGGRGDILSHPELGLPSLPTYGE